MELIYDQRTLRKQLVYYHLYLTNLRDAVFGQLCIVVAAWEHDQGYEKRYDG